MMQYVGQDESSESIGDSLVWATVVIFVGIAVSTSAIRGILRNCSQRQAFPGEL
jgi:hypothetical protein